MKKKLLTILFYVALLFGYGQIVNRPVINNVNRSGHPYLLVNNENIVSIQEKIDNHSWADRNYQSIKERAERFLNKPIDIPNRGGVWPQYYISPVDGSDLRRGKRIGKWRWEHRSKDGNTYLGDSSKRKYDYDGVVIGGIHDGWSKVCIDLGLLFHLEKDKKYADRVREILLAYAEKYNSYPIRNRKGNSDINQMSNGAGRIHMQSFQEAMWLTNLVIGADFIWEQLTKEDQDIILNQLLYPSARLIMAHKREDVHNQPCWKNTAIGLLGIFNNDQELIHYAITDPGHGFQRQLSEGLTTEGMWIERAPKYHFYTLTAMVYLVEAATNAGYKLDLKAFKKMFDGPFNLANPYLKLPAFNDSNEVDMKGQRFLYEWAYKMYKDPRYPSVINGRSRHNTFNHTAVFTDFALLFGVDEMPKIKDPSLRQLLSSSRNLPNTGMGILMKGDPPKSTWVAAKYDPHVGWHSQPDQLSFVVYKGHIPVLIDPGVQSYRSPVTKEWHKSTISHTTFLVDQKEQKPSTAKLLEFNSYDGVDYIILQSDGGYEDVRFIRTIALLNRNTILVVDQFKSREKRTLDISCRPFGTLSSNIAGEPFLSNSRGYNYIQEASTTPIAFSKETNGIRYIAKDKSPYQILYQTRGKDLKIITGEGPGPKRNTPHLLFRHEQASDLAFAWCISLDNQAIDLNLDYVLNMEKNRLPESEAIIVEVKSNDEKWKLFLNPLKKEVLINKEVKTDLIKISMR